MGEGVKIDPKKQVIIYGRPLLCWLKNSHVQVWNTLVVGLCQQQQMLRLGGGYEKLGGFYVTITYLQKSWGCYCGCKYLQLTDKS